MGGGSKHGRASKPLPNPRSEVVRLAERRETLKRDLEQLERQIADYESSYLKSSPYGNAIKGWRSTTAAAGDAASSITDKDRIFSLSSMSWRKRLRLERAGSADGDGASAAADDDDDGSSAGAADGGAGVAAGAADADGGRDARASRRAGKQKAARVQDEEGDDGDEDGEEGDEEEPTRRQTRSRRA